MIDEEVEKYRLERGKAEVGHGDEGDEGHVDGLNERSRHGPPDSNVPQDGGVTRLLLLSVRGPRWGGRAILEEVVKLTSLLGLLDAVHVSFHYA